MIVFQISLPIFFNKEDIALCDDQKTGLSFYIAAEIASMKVLELAGC